MELDLSKIKFESSDEQAQQFKISDGWLYVDSATARRHPLFGTSGWIGFFQLILYVSPVVGILAGIENLSILNGQYSKLVLFNFFIDFFLLFLSWLLASELSNPEPKSVSYIFSYLICYSILFFLTASVAVSMAYSVKPQVDKLLLLHLARDALLIPILAFYFLLSNRVNITYRYRAKVGSAFARSLELTLSKTSLKDIDDKSDCVESSITINKSENLIISKHDEEHELVSIETVSPELENQKKDTAVSDSFFSRLFALKKVLDEGLISDIDYEAKKKSILNDL